MSDTGNKVVVCIPSYKNRFSHIVGNVKNIDTCYDIAIFLSEGDYEASGYDKYDWDAPNISVINTTCKNISEKRQVMLDYAIDHGYTGMFQIDDDIMFIGKRITEATKRTTSDSYRSEDISFNELLHKIEDVCYEQNATFSSPSFIFHLGFSKPGKLNVNSYLNFGQLDFMDLTKVKESGLKYDTSGTTHEDVDFVIELLRHGYKCVTVADYSFKPDNKAMYATSTASLNCNLMNSDHFRITIYLKYRDGITLKVNKNGLMSMVCRLKSYWNTLDIPIKDDAYHKGLYEVCKTRDVKAVREYIIAHQNKKKVT